MKQLNDEPEIPEDIAQVVIDHMQGRSYLYGCVPAPKKHNKLWRTIIRSLLFPYIVIICILYIIGTGRKPNIKSIFEEI